MAARKFSAYRLEPLLLAAMGAHIQYSDSMCLNQRELIEWLFADNFYRRMEGNVHPKQLNKETAAGRSHRGIFKFYAQWVDAFYIGDKYKLCEPETGEAFAGGKIKAAKCWVVTKDEWHKLLHAQDTVK